jgi:hypothetical protein
MTAILRASRSPLLLASEVVAAIGDAIDGAITGAAIGWLERRGYRVEPKGDYHA